MPDRRHQLRPSSAQWHAGLLASLRSRLEQETTASTHEDQPYTTPGPVTPAPDRGAGWYRTPRLDDTCLDRLDRAVLSVGDQPATRRYRVLDVAVEDRSIFVRVQPAAPEDGLLLHLPRTDRVGHYRDLLRGLETPTAARAAQPFARGVLDRLPPSDGSAGPHARAVAAAGVAGLQIVWGPPATGKTTVVVDALSAALDAGQRCLFVSASPVAVDTAIQRLLRARNPRPGQVVRVGPGVLPVPTGRSDVTLDRLVRAQQGELGQLIDRAQQRVLDLREAPDRVALRGTRSKLDGFDLDRYTQARSRLDTAARLAVLSDEVARAERADAELRVRLDGLDAALLERALAAQRARLARAEEHAAAARRELESEGRAPRRWARRRQLADVLRDAEQAAAGQRDTVTALLDGALDPADVLRRDPGSAGTASITTRDTLRREQAERSRAVEDHRVEQERLGREAGPRSEDAESCRRAEAAGLPDLAASLPELEIAAGQADARLESAGASLERLLDRARAESPSVEVGVLDRAGVVASTLSRLIGSRALLRRRYDLVVVDEAAAASLPEVVFAAAQAGRSCLLLGDYLQPGPAVAERSDHYWDHDVFEHFGLTSARAAQHHPGCVVLDTPRRFRPTVVDYLNAIAYQGVLRTDSRPDTKLGTDTDSDSGLVWVDVDGLPSTLSAVRRSEGGPGRIGRSWPAGARVAGAVVARHRALGHSVAVVTPYPEQARLILEELARSGQADQVLVGTGAEVQGHEVDVLVFDTVEDGRGWIAQARRDATGPAADWCRDGLRVVDVAVSRAELTYLIASGRALRGDRGTPMGELLQLCASGRVSRVSARRVLDDSVPQTGSVSPTGSVSQTGSGPQTDAGPGGSTTGERGVEDDRHRAVVDQ